MSGMLKSVEKYVKTQAEQVAAGADNLIAQAKTIQPPTMPALPTLPSISSLVPIVQCKSCRQTISMVDNLLTANKCRICAQIFCSKCISKTPFPVPCSLVQEYWRPKPSSSAPTQPPLDERQLVCHVDCLPVVIDLVMEQFRKEIDLKYASNLAKFLENEDKRVEFFDLPSKAPEDTRLRQALRFVIVAEVFADFTSLSLALKAVKYAYMGSTLIQVLIASDMFAVLQPLMLALKRHGLISNSPTSLLRLYYLGCKHVLLDKVFTLPRSLIYSAERKGVLCPAAPHWLLDYVAQYLSPAQWLYLCRLPPPHEDTDWSSWYLSKIVSRQGYTVLMCVNETTKLPDGTKCPAFALLVRTRKARTGKQDSAQKKRREALLIIRGSASTLDWSINLEESMIHYAYSHIKKDQAEYSIETTHDYVHFGIYKAAHALLNHFSLRSYLITLLQRDYEVSLIGHSLGAAVASMLGAELRNSIIQDYYQLPSPYPSVSLGDLSAQTLEPLPANSFQPLPRHTHASPLPPHLSHITAVVFACPAFAGEALARVWAQERGGKVAAEGMEGGWVVNVVNGGDVIPRCSHAALRRLGAELKRFKEEGKRYLNEDTEDLKDYLGKHLASITDHIISYHIVTYTHLLFAHVYV